MNWKSSPKVSVSGASLDAGVVSLALCSLTPLLSPRSSSHTQTEAHAESLHSTPRDPYGRSRGALILFVHLEVSLYRCCCCFFPSLFPPSPLRPPSPVAPQSSWPPCASHWVLLASGQDCPPFLCAYPTRQHTPPIQAYKEHMIGLLNVNTMTPAHPPAHVHHLKYSRATFPEKLKCSKLFHTSFRNISCSFIQSTHTHTLLIIFFPLTWLRLVMLMLLIDLELKVRVSDREHKCPALTPPDGDLQCYLPVFGEPAWPPWTQCTRDPLSWKTPAGHITTHYFYPFPEQ